MRTILDTDVISEFSKTKPEPRVVAAVAQLDETDIFISAVTIAEIERGLALMPSGRRQSEIRSWLDATCFPASIGGCFLSTVTSLRPGGGSWRRAGNAA